ncbi:MAG: hypothetical protein GY835_28110 [bacterium]|nr:hypothetical protein [bacterium]
MKDQNTISASYVKLALAIDQHAPGYVDAYHGPKEWKIEIDQSDPQPLSQLAQTADQLLADAVGCTGFDEQRRNFLIKQIAAMRSLLDILQGSRVSVYEEGGLLYDIVPQWTDENELGEAHRALDELLPPGKTIYERAQKNKEEARLSFDALERLIHLAAAEFRKRTTEKLPLPENDSFEFTFVKNKPWPAYSRYLGGYSSRIEINTDAPFYVSPAVHFVLHELYPGHHTEISIKEKVLYSEQGREEHCILLLNTPSITVSEGIAERARRVLMPDEEWIEWHSEVIYPTVKLDHLDANRRYLIGKASQRLDGAYGNAAFLMHDQGKSDAEVAEYVKRFGLLSEKDAEGCVKFLRAPRFRTYYFTYLCGGMLLDELYERDERRVDWLCRLLTEPVTPGQIRDWIKGKDST